MRKTRKTYGALSSTGLHKKTEYLPLFTLPADVYRVKVVNREADDQFCTRTAFYVSRQTLKLRQIQSANGDALIKHTRLLNTTCPTVDDYTPPNPHFLSLVDRNTFLRAVLSLVTTNAYKIILYACNTSDRPASCVRTTILYYTVILY